MERAYELARSGDFNKTDEVVERLKEEGFTNVVAHMSGAFTRRELRSLISRSKPARKGTST